MTIYNDPDNYEGYLETVASGIKTERDAGDVTVRLLEDVAQTCVIAQREVEGEVALLFSAEPYNTYRITPFAVILGSDRRLPPPESTQSLRETAVEILRRDLEDYISSD